ncbi:hypothetical protein ILUMI_09009 [Ignelater luminosus]|uniref:Vezatin n=1 Tax=Ignelater luminosus TaxID=2038154 RepID=A0A8K0GA31_IGNLU|nr:hypothetical protein ILUMI_09009 [Ignelater luminosus]
MNVSSINQKFLQDYSHVISYYVDCILQSRMMLDEDMHLMMTFWDPNLFKRRSIWNKTTLISSTCATLGAVFSLKLNNLYPFALSCIPATVQISQRVKCKYMANMYKNNFKNLISYICELYELNRNIIEYCHKRDTAMQIFKTSNEAYTLLLRPGEEFLKATILAEIGILEMLRNSMLKIFELVPVTEGEYIYSLEWNFDEFTKLNSDDFKNLQHHFQKLSDLYVLVVSNFLSCLGLSFCFQLWKDDFCDFKSIFDYVIPELTSTFKVGLNDIKSKFNNIRFTLQDKENETPKRQRHNLKSSKELLQLQKCLEDFLTNMQVVFETGSHLQFLIKECDENLKLANHSQIVEDISTQLVICDDSLDTFLRLYYLLTKRLVKKETNTLPPPSSSNETKIIKEIHYDDPIEPLEDEEYNLSIHGSDDEEIMPFIEYADQFSTEHLELMLHELKIKLKERKGNRDEHDNNRNLSKCSEQVNAKCVKKSQSETFNKLPVEQCDPPLPPPLPFESSNDISPAPSFAPITIGHLPAINNSELGFLDAVKSVAQSLNRDEEVFGSDAVISSDSDES